MPSVWIRKIGFIEKCLLVPLLVIVTFWSCTTCCNRELKRRLWRRQQERQKSNRLSKTTTLHVCTCIPLFCSIPSCNFLRQQTKYYILVLGCMRTILGDYVLVCLPSLSVHIYFSFTASSTSSSLVLLCDKRYTYRCPEQSNRPKFDTTLTKVLIMITMMIIPFAQSLLP